MHDEMPGFFPGRPGGERDEPLLDMILARRPIPPGAPPEIHGLARMLAAAAGSAEPGELAGQDAALAAFTRLASQAGTSPAAPWSARRWLPVRSARGRLPLAAVATAVAAGLGSTAAAYAGVLPSPIQHFAHVMIGAPAPLRDFSQHVPAVASSPARARHEPATSGPMKTPTAASSADVRGKGSHKPWRYGLPGYGLTIDMQASTLHLYPIARKADHALDEDPRWITGQGENGDVAPLRSTFKNTAVEIRHEADRR